MVVIGGNIKTKKVFKIAKQQSCQKFIYKIHSTRLRKAKWNLTLPISEARKNDEVISLADSTTLRFIDDIKNIKEADKKARQIKSQIKSIKKKPTSAENKKEIRRLYTELDKLQYKPDYLCVIIDKIKDYRRMCVPKGFKLNGIKYERLVGTNGGVKNETIVFASEIVLKDLRKRMENGRNAEKTLVPAKFESYKALCCSGSIPVSNPNGVLVVDDFINYFSTDYIELNDKETDEPIMTIHKKDINDKIELNDSDGYGVMLPSIAKRWCKELGENYIMSGACIRNSWTKGMLFTFEFDKFAEEIAEKYIVKDAWGNDVDIRNVEIILTTSMLKLWDSYNSCEHYFKCCNENGYSFSITKACPEKLENERDLNYQFIQTYDLTDEQIEELIKPTIDEINDVLGGDYRKSILFLKGMFLNDDNIDIIDCDFIKALMIDKSMINDPFVRNKIHQMIKKRINEAKTSVIKVNGNFSIVSGDPYALCQHIFKTEEKGSLNYGLLKEGESYNKYWIDKNVEKVACYRAPMTCHNNIRILKMPNKKDINRWEQIQKWYKYMNTVTIFNCWDTAAHALNGLDKDSDSVLTTNTSVLVENTLELPAIMCVQRKAPKIVITEESLIQANINSFGDAIGTTTNHITSMIEVMSQFEKDSKEYKILDYRVKCGQLYQQNAIDKTKGIIAKPMPKEWYDRTANKIDEKDSEEIKNKKKFNQSIIADKKPYFMNYIYPQQKAIYEKYINNTNKKSMREFGISMQELINKPNKTKIEKEFIKYYYLKMPVGINNCVCNRICWRFEQEFNGYLSKIKPTLEFDYSILKYETIYSMQHFNMISKLYESYIRQIQDYMQLAKSQRLEKDDVQLCRETMKQNIQMECFKICNNEEQLCNIVLDLCYQKNTSKQFAWDVCGDLIIQRLLQKNNYIINYPVQSDEGDIDYCGQKFKMESKNIGKDDEILV